MEEFKIIRNIITGIRSLRADYNIEPGKRLNIAMSAGKDMNLLEENIEILKALARLDEAAIEKKIEKPDGAIGFVESGVEVYIDLAGSVDVKAEKKRIKKEIDNVKPYVISLEKKLAGDFIKKAPEQVIQVEKKKLEDAKEKLLKLEEQMNQL